MSVNPAQGHIHVIPIVHEAVLSRMTWFSRVSVNQKTESALCADQWHLCRKCFSCFSHRTQPCGVCCLGELEHDWFLNRGSNRTETVQSWDQFASSVLHKPRSCPTRLLHKPHPLSAARSEWLWTAQTTDWFYVVFDLIPSLSLSRASPCSPFFTSRGSDRPGKPPKSCSCSEPVGSTSG